MMTGTRPSTDEEAKSAGESMMRSGASLVVSAGVLTVSGFAFWLVIGRSVDDQALGEVAGLTSLVLFLSGITRLNMAASLPAVLSGAGRAGLRLLGRAYGAAVAIGTAVSLVLVLWSVVTGEGLDGALLWLVPICVVAWSIFSMQDGALVGARAAGFVAVENTAYSVVRLVAAVVVMAISPTVAGAMIAWFGPLLLAVPAANLKLWRSYQGPSKPGWTEVGFSRLVASDFVGSVAILASTRGFAYLALLVLPPGEGSDLAIAWLFFITVDVVFLQASNALAAESSRSPEHRTELALSAARSATALGIVGGLIGIVASPLLLGLLVDDPSGDLVTTLRLIFVALTARPVLHVWLAQSRAKRDLRALTVGPVVSLFIFVMGVAPGLVGNDMVVVAAGVALSQWIMAVAAWVDLRLDPRPVVEESADSADDEFSSMRMPLRVESPTTPVTTPVRRPFGFGPGANVDAAETAQLDREELLSFASYSRSRVRLGSALLLAGMGLLALSVPLVDYSRVDGLGLIRALPIVFWLSVACTTAGFLVFLLLPSSRGVAWAVGVLTVSLHGIEPMSAPAGRFSVAWLLGGFSDTIARTGANPRLIDARFSWPGFFFGPAAGLSGNQNGFAGPNPDLENAQLFDIEPLVRFWPVGVMLMWVLLVWCFARHWFPERWLAAPLASWFFVILAWTGQDYFSPQSMGVTITAIIVLLIVVNQPDLPQDVSWRQRMSWTVIVGGSTSRHPAVTAAILVLATAVIVTHPLSPVFLTLWLLPLALAGYRYARGLPLVVFVAFLTWVSGAAQPWWKSRIEGLVDNVGAVGSTVSASTSDRTADASFDRWLVLLSRAEVVVVVGELGLIAAFYLWRRQGKLVAVVALAMAAMPALAVAGQPYGGEILVRVFLFSVFPAAVLLGAAMSYALSERFLVAMIVLATVIGAPALIINRYGNESYEMTRLSDREALATMYREAPADTLFVTDNPFLSWGFTRFDRIDGARNHFYLRRLSPEYETVARAADVAREAGYTYVAIATTRSQEAWGYHTVGRDEDWLTRVAEFLEDQPDVETLYHDGASGAFLIRAADIPELEPEAAEDSDEAGEVPTTDEADRNEEAEP